jgi:hypothetical protein
MGSLTSETGPTNIRLTREKCTTLNCSTSSAEKQFYRIGPWGLHGPLGAASKVDRRSGDFALDTIEDVQKSRRFVIRPQSFK